MIANTHADTIYLYRQANIGSSLGIDDQSGRSSSEINNLGAYLLPTQVDQQSNASGGLALASVTQPSP